MRARLGQFHLEEEPTLSPYVDLEWELKSRMLGKPLVGSVRDEAATGPYGVNSPSLVQEHLVCATEIHKVFSKNHGGRQAEFDSFV